MNSDRDFKLRNKTVALCPWRTRALILYHPHAAPTEVLATSTVRDLLAGSDIAFHERGEHELTGVPGTRRLYAAFAGGP